MARVGQAAARIKEEDPSSIGVCGHHTAVRRLRTQQQEQKERTRSRDETWGIEEKRLEGGKDEQEGHREMRDEWGEKNEEGARVGQRLILRQAEANRMKERKRG